MHDQIGRACQECQRSAGSVQLLAVSKVQPASKIRELYQLGQRDFGENYVQELLLKAEELKDLGQLRWHYIGHLQRNKLKKIASVCQTVHTLARIDHAVVLAKAAQSLGRVIDVFCQVNISRESLKHGCDLSEVSALVAAVAALPGLRFQGLMSVPAADFQDPAAAEPLGALPQPYLELRQLQAVHGGGLSPGMSGDLRLAIAAGSSWVRVGTALFGPRVSGRAQDEDVTLKL